jgi:glycosyltransferase involved in cell wall biosynthesis
MISKTGIKGLLYRYFRRKEKRLYRLSDHIGCMSPSNVDYLLKHNQEIEKDKVEVAPNCVELTCPGTIDTVSIRQRYNLPQDRPVFIYGGNLGKPQGVPFLISCLESNANRPDCHFVVVGTGTELPRLKSWYNNNSPSSVTVLDGLPKSDYDELVCSCDVGLIFLDHRFTIPNYPSRLLSYLENKMPIISATDPNTDIGKISEENGFGYWCESNSVEAFNSVLEKMIASDIKSMGEKGFRFLMDHYLVDQTYETIMKHV